VDAIGKGTRKENYLLRRKTRGNLQGEMEELKTKGPKKENASLKRYGENRDIHEGARGSGYN